MDEDESGQEVASSDESVQMQFKDHFIFALSTSSTGCLQHASGFFLPVCKRNNTLIILFGQNAFDLLVALGRVLAGGLNLLSSHGSGSSQARPDISRSSASGAAGTAGFQGEIA